MRRRPTIIDVALKAGVSKSTVSLVLQDSLAVKAETRTRVRHAMASIGYVYNRSAANLRSAKTGLVGLVINDLRNPFFTEFAASLQMALSARGYATVIGNTNEDPALQDQVVSAMIEHGVSAVVISPVYGDETFAFEQLRQAEIPAMQVLRKVEGRTNTFPFAAPDYGLGSRLATEHMLSLGAKRIAFVGGLAGRAVTQERMSGYLTCLSERGIAPIAIPGRSTRSFGREVAMRMAGDWPDVDAALCFNDLVALGMLSGFAETGRAVGSDFRLAGFDDIEECAQAFPSLTSVRCNIAGFAEQIAATVLAWLEDGQQPQTEERTTVELVVRNSTISGRA